MNKVFETELFTKICDACDNQEKVWIEKIKDKLVENLLVGKPLRFNWFREKKFGNKRLYFLINEKTMKAVLIAFGTKKDQQEIIAHIIVNKEKYLRLID